MLKPKIILGLPRPTHPGEMIGLDTEFFGMNKAKLHRPHGEFACATFAYDDGTVYMITDFHDIREALARVDSGKWVLQNAAFDIRQLRRWADIPPRRIWDTQIVDQGLFGGYYSLFNLGVLSARWLGFPLEKEARDAFSDGTSMDPIMQKYAATDALATLKIAQQQIQFIAEKQLSIQHYWLADHPALWASLDMLPAKVDVKSWHKLAEGFENEARRLEAKFGSDFNPRSVQQVKKRIEQMIGHSVPGTAVDVLEQLAEEHPENEFIQDMLEYRTYATMISKYGKNWLEEYVEEGDLVYSNWKINGANTTCRMSSADPNLQNIPSKTQPIYRTMFVAGKNEWMSVMDVAQQEPRILAVLSGDKFLNEILKAGRSPHIELGKVLYDDPDFNKKDPRYPVAKSTNLGLDYGLTATGLARNTGIPLHEAERVLRVYFQTFPGVNEYIQKYRASGHRNGYVESLLRRRLYLNPYTYKWKNNAINCLDAETEALTQRGWIKGFDLRQDDVLLTKNSTTGDLIWQHMDDLKFYPDYVGPMVEFSSKSFNALSTPNHRWLVTDRSTGKSIEKTSDTLSPWGDHRIHRTGTYKPSVVSILTPDESELLGWFITDGHLRRPSVNPKRMDPRRGPKVQILQSQRANPEKCRRIDQLLERMNIIPKRHISAKGTYITWTIPKELSAKIVEVAPERTLKLSTLLSLDVECLHRLREAMLLGDGTVYKNKISLDTGRLEQAENFQILCTMTGNTASIVWRDMSSYTPHSNKMNNSPKSAGCWRINIQQRQTAQVTHSQRRKYFGKFPVWCPVVQNSFFVARRHGQVFITGNSPIQGSAGEQIKITMGLIHQESHLQGLPFYLSMVVHDETVARPEKHDLKKYEKLAQEAWHQAGKMTLGDAMPLVVEMAHGTNWGCKQ